MNLIPENYKYLWTDHDINYIFTSCYLFKKFREADIVLIYDWKEKALKFFLSEKDMKGFSESAVEFYGAHFLQWEKEIIINIKKGEKLAVKNQNMIDDLRGHDHCGLGPLGQSAEWIVADRAAGNTPYHRIGGTGASRRKSSRNANQNG